MTDDIASAFNVRDTTVVYLYILLGILISTETGFFPACLPKIREYLDISYTEGGILGSVNFLGFCLSSPVFGYLANYKPPVKLTLLGIILYVGPLLVMSVSGTYWWILIMRFVLSFGEALIWSVAPVIIDFLAPSNRRSLLNTLFMGNVWLAYTAGQMIGSTILDYEWFSLPQSQSWRIMVVAQAFLTAILIPCFLIIKGPNNLLSIDSSQVRKDTDTVSQKIVLIFKNRTYLWSCIGNTVLVYMIQGVMFYLSDFMQDVFNFSIMRAGTTVGILVGVTVIFGIFTGGFILDWAIESKAKKAESVFSLMEMCQIALKLSSLGLSIAAISSPLAGFKPFSTQHVPFYALFCFNMLLVCMTIGPINNAILWSVELKDRPFAKSISNVSTYLFARVPAPLVVGFVKETWGWSWTFFYMGCHVMLAFFIITIAHCQAKRTVKLDQAKTELVVTNVVVDKI